MISLITSIYSNNSHKYFFNAILEQKKEVFELILLTNSVSLEFARKIKEVENNPNIKLKIIFTTREIGFNESIIEAIKMAEGTHAIIVNGDEQLSKTFVSDLTEVVEKNKNTDIFEFKATFKGFEKWTPQKRCDLKQNHSFKIEDYPKILAFTFPFMANKLFKISLARSIENKTAYIQTTSSLSIEFLYMLFLEAKTYVYVNKPPCSIFIDKNDIPNFSNFYKEWQNIRKQYSLANKFIQEIEYANMFYIEIIIPLLYSHKKLTNILFHSPSHTNLLLKIFERNKKARSNQFNNFNHANKYMLLNLLETEYLNKSHPPNEWSKISRIFKE